MSLKLTGIIACALVISIFLGCEVLINPSAEINVRQNDTDILSGGEYDFGNIPVGETSPEITFTIESIGNTKLIISADPDLINISGDTSDFIIDQSNIFSVLEPGESTGFEISMTPTSEGTKSVTITIANNDLDENPYTIVIKGKGIISEINVRQGTNSIISGSGVYDFGEIEVNSSSPEIAFTIENKGTEVLKLTNTSELIAVQGTDASMFVVNHTSTDSSISPGETTTFTIIFSPASEGSKEASIIIENSDLDENPYRFTVLGSGLDHPEIAIFDSSSNEILNITGEFNFGELIAKNNKIEVFGIYNLGKNDLLITDDPKVKIIASGTNPFSVVTIPIDSISPGQNSVFSIKFEPQKVGTYQAAVSIANNDSDENPFTFTIIGKCIEPEINVKQGSTDILSGSGTYDFGSIKADTSSQAITFTIENLGDYYLYLAGNPDKIEISGTDSSMFSIDETNTKSPVSKGAPTTFTITFTPTSDGLKTATILIKNTDFDESFYTFTITGTGFYEPEINVTDANHVDIPNNTGTYDFGDVIGNHKKFGTFYVENLGKKVLLLTGFPAVEIKGSGASAFKVVLQPSSNIVPGSYGELAIWFSPTQNQEYNAIVSIANDDSDENPYTFNIKGKGLAAEINIKDSKSNDIISGTGLFVFENIEFDETDDETFTIENLGDYELLLTGTPIIDISGTGASVFHITSQPLVNINSKSSTIFTLEFVPVTVGKFQATVSIANSDSDENPYTFTITGTSKFKKSDSDFNGDGYPDIAIGAGMADGGALNSGVVYVYFGGPNWNNSYTTNEADITINGQVENDRVFCAQFVGDVNNDGFDDLAITQTYDKKSTKLSGQVFIFFGQQNPSKVLKTTDCDINLTGENKDDSFGPHVITYGDINNDGINDLVTSSYRADDNGKDCGNIYVFFGKDSWDRNIDASNADIKVIGEAAGDHFGDHATARGDINGDGIDDLIMEALKTNDPVKPTAGYLYIFFGRNNWNSKIYAVNADVKISGNDAGDYLGRSLTSEGDVNNDGISDIVISATNDDDNGFESGNVFIFFGRSSWSSQYSASQADVIIQGEYTYGYFGLVWSCSGDLNKDGISDIVIGTPNDDIGGDFSGAVYIFYGRSNWSSTISQKSANCIIECNLARDRFGSSASTSDINQDGYVDLIVGASEADGSVANSGSVYIYFGRSVWNSIIDSINYSVKLLGKAVTDGFGSTVSAN